jgi:hypothetical protein
MIIEHFAKLRFLQRNQHWNNCSNLFFEECNNKLGTIVGLSSVYWNNESGHASDELRRFLVVVVKVEDVIQ